VGRRSTWAAWGLLAFGCVGYAVSIAWSVVEGTFSWRSGEVVLWVVFGAFLVVGCLILAHRPGNAIGWIFAAVGLLRMIAGLAETYTGYADAHPGSLPAPLVAAWVLTWIASPTLMLTLVFPLLLFPNGRPLSTGWRPVTWLAVGLTAVFVVLDVLRPTIALPHGRTVANPIGVASADIHPPVSTILVGPVVFVLVAAIVSLVVRFRRSRGVERQQLKWFTYAGALALLSLPSHLLLPGLGITPYLLVLALPIAMGVAVLRYRLYDIDRLIGRTLVYGLLTALLGAVYAGASTDGATTRPRPSRPSALGCTSRSTWTPSRPTSSWSLTRPCRRPMPRCGFDPPRTTPGVRLAARPGLLPGPTERDCAPQSRASQATEVSRHLSDGALGRPLLILDPGRFVPGGRLVVAWSHDPL
jgi:hypothetical protein